MSIESRIEFQHGPPVVVTSFSKDHTANHLSIVFRASRESAGVEDGRSPNEAVGNLALRDMLTRDQLVGCQSAVYERHGDTFKAYRPDKRSVWEVGRTPQEALRGLARTEWGSVKR